MNNVQRYKDHCRPKLTELLQALKLDKTYSRAEGNYLQTDTGEKILDLVGGFGCTILGHNHPEIVAEAISALAQGVAINAQGSIRTESAHLAQRLSKLTGSQRGYCVNFSNSGAESIEAAVKHAYKVQFDKVRREYERLTRVLNDLYYKIEREQISVELPGDNTDLIDFRDDLDEYNLAQFEQFQNNPVMIAFKGAFHGKTSSALKVTFNKSYREAFEGLSAIQPAYVDIHRPEQIAETVDEQVCTFYYPVLTGTRIELRPVRITRVIAMILEVVLGEGGIRPVPDATLSHLAELKSERHIPLIIDEIQTGCGRTGSIFGYHDTPLRDIEPEYIALSKALGGGISKIGATLIHRNTYDADFGILHTSTFAEDDLSARIANKTLDILTRDDNAMLKQVRDKSAYLLDRLHTLQECYPTLIKNVRGRGLMLGVELTPLLDRSPFFRASGKQGVLSLLVASYLLEYHNTRILAPLTTMLKGNPGKSRLSILRIQPPATITREEVDRFVDGLREVLDIIENNNEYCLIAHLLGERVSEDERSKVKRIPVRWPVVEEKGHIDSRVGFIVHPTTLDKLVEYYFPSFHHYQWQPEHLENWWNLISRFLEPVHVKSTYIKSNDFTIENNLVFVPYMPEYITKQKNHSLTQEVQDKIQDAVTVARELGDDNIPVSMVGLGAFTSIATQNGLTLNDYEVAVTTGNAYTTALTIQGIMQAAASKELDLSKAAVAVIGASGNIGMVVSRVIALNVGKLCLIGRPGERGLTRLDYVRQQCLQEIVQTIHLERQSGVTLEQSQLSGIGLWIYQQLEQALTKPEAPLYDIACSLEHNAPAADVGKQLSKVIDPDLLDSCIPLQSGLDSLHEFDVIIAATNSTDRELIRPDLVKPDAIVCCTSIPSNLSRQFNQDDSTQLAFDGGLAKLPEGAQINFVGMPKDGLAFGCMAETLLLGFDGQNHSFCKGMLTAEQVYRTIELAELHGFSLGELKLDDQLLTPITRLKKSA
ncbi:MAG TPA: aminotransferase class III-fold pyridoxal phosphate-dependent enzyme [Gammaproteobacteria bacterium]|nr:aminotransferase class III-fold pyridoxal phosphate-dependent enzyme [Gammaproteobacteria bacterium]